MSLFIGQLISINEILYDICGLPLELRKKAVDCFLCYDNELRYLLTVMCCSLDSGLHP